MWFRRDLRLGDNPALLEAVADGDAPAVRARPGTLGPGRAVPPRVPRRARCVRSMASSGSGRRGSAWSAATRYAGWSSPRRRSAPSGCTSPPTTAPTAAARSGRRAGARRRRHRAGPHGLAVRRRSRPGDQRLRRAVQGLHAVQRGLGRTTAGAARSTRPPDASWLELDEDTTDIPDPALPGGLELPEAGESAARRRWEEFLERVDATARTATSPASTAPRACPSTSSGVRSTRARCWPHWPGSGAPAPRRTAGSSRWREFYADVLFAPAADGARVPPAGVRADAVRPAGSAARGVAGGPNRLPGRRRGHAPASRNRLDAQPGPDDRGQLPGQGPAPRVAARRPTLHAVAGRRRPGLQPARLAVDRGQWHRRGAVLPGLQPDQPGSEVRP